MKSYITITALAGLALSGLSSSAWAQAPQQLYNKTILVSMTITIPGKGADSSTITNPRSIDRTIYVSNAGRIFARSVRRAGRNTKTTERGPADPTLGGLRFQGARLAGVLPFASGAALLNVTFDPSYSSCSADVVVGRDNGKPIVWKGLNGVAYTSTGAPSVSGVSCSIRDGNPFAG
jgi:hypothetical protein